MNATWACGVKNEPHKPTPNLSPKELRSNPEGNHVTRPSSRNESWSSPEPVRGWGTKPRTPQHVERGEKNEHRVRHVRPGGAHACMGGSHPRFIAASHRCRNTTSEARRAGEVVLLVGCEVGIKCVVLDTLRTFLARFREGFTLKASRPTIIGELKIPAISSQNIGNLGNKSEQECWVERYSYP